MKKKKIFICGISTECCSYSTLNQNEKDFEIISGKKLLNYVAFNFSKYNDLTIIPNKFYRSVPGGPVNRNFFLKVVNNTIRDIKKKLPLDGVFLILHGAMYVKGIDDPEGFLIKKIRSILNKDSQISVSFDLHGQMTSTIIKNINYFAAFKTAPHIDVEKTYARSLQMLIQGIKTGVKNYILWEKIPVLVSGEMSSTTVSPCLQIYKKLDAYNTIRGINDSNLLIGYVWADTKRATASAIVNCSDPKKGKEILKKISLSYWNNRKKLIYDMRSYKLNKVFDFINHQPLTILADSGDNPTAGGVGNRIDVLEYVINKKIKNVLFAGIYNSKIFIDLKRNKKSITVQDKIAGKKVSIKIEKIKIIKNCAIINSNNNTIIFTKYRRPFHYLKDFKELDILIKDYKILVVKSGYLSPELKTLKAANFMILSEGFVTQDFNKIKNLYRERPIYPFQNNFEYKFQTKKTQLKKLGF